MILPRKQLQSLVKQGKAREAGLTKGRNDGHWLVIVDRYDLQRVDHYHATDADLDRIEAESVSM